jgi:integrase
VAVPIKHRGKWRIRWSDASGRRCSEVHDEYRVAQVALARHLANAEEVRKGRRAPDPPDKTFDDLCDLWLEKRAPRKRSGKNDLSVIRQLKKHFGGLKLRNIGVEDADDYVDSRDDLEPKTVANHLTLLISMFNYAAELSVPWVYRVPPFKKPKIISLARDYRYLRNEEEVARFLRASRELEGELVFMLYLTAVRTGMRAGELAGLEWGDVDFEQRLIMVQRSFTGPTKSGRARPVPILNALLADLRSWRLRHPGKLVFTNRDGNMLAPSGRVFQEVLHRVLGHAEFPTSIGHGDRVRHYITFHGLRHTFASQWMMRGGNIFKLQKILGHQSTAMTERYAHLSPNLFAEDYDRMGPGAATQPAETILLSGTGR